MPELPEAETIARGLAKLLVNALITGVSQARLDVVKSEPKHLCDQLPGRTVLGVRRRGKRIGLALSGLHSSGNLSSQRYDLQRDAELVFALGMTGRLTIVDTATEVAVHTHLRVFLNGERELRFRDPRRFGGIWFIESLNGPNEIEPLDLGPEPLTLALSDFRRLLSRHRQIKALLLDQHVIAGLGNIYCDESLHRAGLHPLTPADRLNTDQVRKLHQAIRTVLNSAIKAGGSTLSDYRTATGTEGFFQTRHRVYDRANEPCRKCGMTIRRILAAGRSSFFCPHCQPAPR